MFTYKLFCDFFKAAGATPSISIRLYIGVGSKISCYLLSPYHLIPIVSSATGRTGLDAPFCSVINMSQRDVSTA